MAPLTTTTVVQEEESFVVDDVNNVDFLLHAKKLCSERNIKFENIINARDLSSPLYSTIKPGILYRTGRVSDATANDIQTMKNQLQIQTLIDLRSPSELRDDPTLLRSDVFETFTTLVWQQRSAGTTNCLKELPYNHPPFTRRSFVLSCVARSLKSFKAVETITASAPAVSCAGGNDVDVEVLNEKAIVVSDNDVIDDNLDCTAECLQGLETAKITSTRGRKERYFVSLMTETDAVKGVISKVKKRDKRLALIKAPIAIFSKRVLVSVLKPFLDVINNGGLQLSFEFLIRYGGQGIRYVLELCADETYHPIALYCSAGKDRTGFICALILALCNVPDESIIEDYYISANAFANMNDHTAMIRQLERRSLDPKRFLIAPPSVMIHMLNTIKEQYGSVHEYCTSIGFTPDKQQQLRNVCMVKPN